MSDDEVIIADMPLSVWAKEGVGVDPRDLAYQIMAALMQEMVKLAESGKPVKEAWTTVEFPAGALLGTIEIKLSFRLASEGPP